MNNMTYIVSPHKEGDMEAYCVKCRSKVEINNPQQVTLKNGRPATKGICSNGCGTNVFRIGKAS